MYNLNEVKKAAQVIRTINNPLRYQVIELLNDKELNVTEIHTRLKIPQEVASQQLHILRQFKVLNYRRDGKYIFYSVNTEMLKSLLNIVQQLNQFYEK